LCVASYNIREGGRGRVDALARVLRAQHPDAVALLEANDRATAEALGRELAMELVYGEANNGVSVAWLSRLPVRRAENHRRPALSKTLLEIEVAAAVGVVRLFATHLASRHDRPAHTPEQEVQVILRELAASTGVPHLLVGDLNSLHPMDRVGTPPPGETKRGDAVDGAPRLTIRWLLEAGYLDCFRALHPEAPGYTYPTQAPWLRLDYVFASRLLAPHLEDCWLEDGDLAAHASDHFPVVATFRDT
jgi:endonuclease/exonuclease/phosphatase family metal-dependent hydrolase